MAPKILRRCDVCKGFHASYLVSDAQFGKRYLCYKCWKALYAAGPASPPGRGADTGPTDDAPPLRDQA